MMSPKLDDNPRIISVHVPKCAGTSLFAWLKNTYGEGSILLDYDDRPMDPSSICNVDPVSHQQKTVRLLSKIGSDKRVIHGHFLATKYDFIENYKITFLRHPIERALSNYFYWVSMPVKNNRLHEYVVKNTLQWQEFVSLPVIKKIYSGLFFRNSDMRDFYFIGDFSNFERELQRLADKLGFSAGSYHLNVTSALDLGYKSKTMEILSEYKNINYLETCLREDILFYEKWKCR